MDLKDLWISIIEKLFETVPRAQMITWFKNTAILSTENGVMTVGLPLPYFLDWQIQHFMKPTLEIAKIFDPSIEKVTYQVEISLNGGDPRAIDLLRHFPEKAARKLPRKNEVVTKAGVVSKLFNPKYTLENFITSPENSLAHAACQNVAKYPGEKYNPLFIYGGVGLGKTHLLQATGNEILKNNPSCVIVYTTTEGFTNEVVEAIQSHNMNHIRNKYRKVDVLIIDDIQFIANKDRTQEEFFHTFNSLHESGKQIIISSDRPPHELTLLNERLVSRFASGMIVDVKMPDYETRLAILQTKCQEAQVLINREVLELIAMNITDSVRALEGVLTQAIAKYELEHTSPTVKSVTEMIRQTQKEVKMIGVTEYTSSEPFGAATPEKLIECVASYYNVPKEEVTGDSRLREYLVPRQIAMYIAKNKMRMSLSKIGEVIGHRNHTAVMHAVERVEHRLKTDRQLLRDLNAMIKELGLQI